MRFPPTTSLLFFFTLTLLTLNTATSKQPNILFLAADDLRTEFNAFGSPYIHSPNLDKLTKSGVGFLNAYCQQAVCSPSRTSLLTGLRPDSTRIFDLETHFRDTVPSVVALPQFFKNHGYHTQAFGKVYHSSLNDEASWSVPWERHKTPAYAKNYDKQPGKKNGPAYEFADVSDETYSDGVLAQEGIQTLNALKKDDKPFFLALGFHKPHLPFIAPQKYWDMYDPATIKLAPNPFLPHDAPEFAMSMGGELLQYAGTPKKVTDITDEQARTLKHGYYASISYIDAQIGKVLDELDRLDLADDTIVVLWGDHGWKLGEHGAWCKHTNYENDAHAPLIIRAPGMAANGHTTTSLAEFIDIYPTLVELAGLEKPDHLEGVSLVPVLNDSTAQVRQTAWSRYHRNQGKKSLVGYSMRNNSFRFTRWVNKDDHSEVVAEELYDQIKDPQENQNVADNPEYAQKKQRMLKQWQEGVSQIEANAAKWTSP